MSSLGDAVGTRLGRLVPLLAPRLMVKVAAARRLDTEVELGRWITESFEREGIPFPHRVVYLQSRTP